MAVFPFIISKCPKDALGETIIRHEKIHFKQQLEMLFVFFFIWYITEFLILLIKYGNKDVAYKKISFEQEAYACERELDYLKTRKNYSWFIYL
jgi:hypothetical protein